MVGLVPERVDVPHRPSVLDDHAVELEWEGIRVGCNRGPACPRQRRCVRALNPRAAARMPSQGGDQGPQRSRSSC
jgi:hypothetical protein